MKQTQPSCKCWPEMDVDHRDISNYQFSRYTPNRGVEYWGHNWSYCPHCAKPAKEWP